MMIDDVKTFLFINEPSGGYTNSSQVCNNIVAYLRGVFNCEEHGGFSSSKGSFPENSRTNRNISFETEFSENLNFCLNNDRFFHRIIFEKASLQKTYRIYDYITNNKRYCYTVTVISEEKYDKK